jgi:hypothetical protein
MGFVVDKVSGTGFFPSTLVFPLIIILKLIHSHTAFIYYHCFSLSNVVLLNITLSLSLCFALHNNVSPQQPNNELNKLKGNYWGSSVWIST